MARPLLLAGMNHTGVIRDGCLAPAFGDDVTQSIAHLGYAAME